MSETLKNSANNPNADPRWDQMSELYASYPALANLPPELAEKAKGLIDRYQTVTAKIDQLDKGTQVSEEDAAKAREDQLQREAEDRLQRAAEDKRQKAAEDKRQKALEDRIQKTTEDQLQREAEDQLQREEEHQRAAAVQEIMSEDEKEEKIAALKKRYYEVTARLNELDGLEQPQDQPQEGQPDDDQPDDKQPESQPNATPLVAISADFTHDQREMAHDLAEQDLNSELDEAKGLKGIASRIWKGTLFKKYYTEKYTQDYLKGDRTTEDGKSIKDLIKEQKQDVIERFVLGATEDENFIHAKAGETLEKADPELNAKIQSAIESYARATLEPGQKVKDLNRNFKNDIARALQEAADAGHLSQGSKYTNYLDVAKEAAKRYQEVAINARGKAEQEMAMAQVMAGFQVYNAEVRNGARTEAHRDNIDKIVDKLESSKIGQFIPAEILAGAAGATVALTQTGARAILGAAGGILASSALAGLRERNRITEDRVRKQRDVASGLSYGNSTNKKTQKYEQRIGDTLYDLQSASELTSNLEAALDLASKEKGHNTELMQAMAEARVRVAFSDEAGKDLIAYSSAQNRGKERLALDKALIMAEKALTDKGKKDYEAMQAQIKKEIVESIDRKDADFNNFRTIASVKKAGKTLALGTAAFFGSQELVSLIDPNKIGIFEKAGLIKTNNAEGAQETILARGLGRLRGDNYAAAAGATGATAEATSGNTGEATNATETVTSYHTDTVENVSDPDQIAKLEAAGYTKTEVSPAFSEQGARLAEVDPSASSARVDVRYDGWANNGTRLSDGNELRAHIENGKFISTMRGTSTLNGQPVSYDPTSVKAYLTIGDSKFEIAGSLNEAGQMTWGDNGVFTTTTGETIKAIGDNGERLYRYFEIAADNGVDPDGVQHIIPLATDIGTNTFSGKIEEVVMETIENPAVYTFTKNIPVTETFIRETANAATEAANVVTETVGGVTLQGLAFAPELGRRGLGTLRYDPETAQEAPEAPSTPEEPQDTANAQEAPQAAPEASEPAPEPEPGYNEWDTEIKGRIDNLRDLIGDEGIAILTDTEPITEEKQEEYGSWFDGLSDEGRAAVADIVNSINSSDYAYDTNWGNGFRVYATLNNLF